MQQLAISGLTEQSDLDNYTETVPKHRVAEAPVPSDGLAAVDTETYIDEDAALLRRWVAGVPNNRPFCMTVTTCDGNFYIEAADIPKNRWLSDPAVTKVFHNAKYDLHMLSNIGVDVVGVEDTMAMIHLIDEELRCRTPDGKEVWSKKLKDLAYHFLGMSSHHYEEQVQKARGIIAKERGCVPRAVTYRDVALRFPGVMRDYACYDTAMVYRLYPLFKSMIGEQDLQDPYQIDLAAMLAVLEIERTGIPTDAGYYTRLAAELSEQLAGIDTEIQRRTGSQGLSIASARDTVQMFRHLGFEWPWYTQKGNPKTDAAALKRLRDGEVGELAKLILQRRELEKLRGTFVEQMQQYRQHTGRVHPNFNVSPNDDSAGGTVTGRLSCSQPNFQNVPKDDARIRRGVAAPQGYHFLEVDYDQQEYRMLGVYSGDPSFSSIIQSGKDIHTGTAELMLRLTHEEAMLKKNRDIGKRLNFAIVYGQGNANTAAALGYRIDTARYKIASKLFRDADLVPWELENEADALRQLSAAGVAPTAEQLDAVGYYFSDEALTAVLQAKDMKTQYFNQFPLIKDWLKEAKRRCQERGYAKTWTGRRRHIADPKQAYKGPNATIQGGCGDILKKKLPLLNDLLRPTRSRVVNTVHDSVLFLIHDEEAHLHEEVCRVLEDLPFSLPFTASASVGQNWGEMEDIERR